MNRRLKEMVANQPLDLQALNVVLPHCEARGLPPRGESEGCLGYEGATLAIAFVVLAIRH